MIIAQTPVMGKHLQPQLKNSVFREVTIEPTNNLTELTTFYIVLKNLTYKS
jgi:hypothetical protein